MSSQDEVDLEYWTSVTMLCLDEKLATLFPTKPMTFSFQCQCSTNWPTKAAWQVGFKFHLNA